MRVEAKHIEKFIITRDKNIVTKDIVDDLNHKDKFYVTRQSTKHDVAPFCRHERLVNTASWGGAVTGIPPDGEC